MYKKKYDERGKAVHNKFSKSVICKIHYLKKIWVKWGK